MQMAYSGFTDHPAELMVLGPFFEAHSYVIEYDQGVADAIHERCLAFYQSLAGDTPPDLDDSVATYEAVRAPYTPTSTAAQSKSTTGWPGNLQTDPTTSTTSASFEKPRPGLLDLMGNAQTAMCGDIKIADRRPYRQGLHRPGARHQEPRPTHPGGNRMTVEHITSDIEILRPPNVPLQADAIGQLMVHARAMTTAKQLADALCDTDLVPAIYKGKPGTARPPSSTAPRSDSTRSSRSSRSSSCTELRRSMRYRRRARQASRHHRPDRLLD